MIVPDTNLLLYAYDRTSPLHAPAKVWWEHCLNGRESVGLPEVVAMAFLRLVTHPTLHKNPMGISQATEILSSWLRCPTCHLLSGRETTLPRAWRLVAEAGRGGNLTTDSWIAALAIEADAVVHTADREFSRFPGLRCKNPLAKEKKVKRPRPARRRAT